LLFSWPRKADTLFKPAEENREASPSERDNVWMGAVEKDVLLILYIMSITQVTNRGGIVSPGHSFNS